jgi:hypothetical protein
MVRPGGPRSYPPSDSASGQSLPDRPTGTAGLLPSLAHSPGPACTRATLDTSGPTFAAFLLGVIVIVGGLIYFPMLILGPIGERIIG